MSGVDKKYDIDNNALHVVMHAQLCIFFIIFALQVFNDFASRDELIHAVLTSVHIPVVLDWRPLRPFKKSYYIDGFIRGKVPVRDDDTVVVEVRI